MFGDFEELNQLKTGIAQGGPRDGVKISALPNWDGKIAKRSQVSGPATRYIDGRYEWRYSYADRIHTWCWNPKPPPEPTLKHK